MTKEEIYDIYNEICKIVDGTYLYHDDYLVGSYNWNSDESSLFFTVYGHSDQGEGAEWEEEWAIDRDGEIYDSRTIHNSLEDFKNNW